MTFRAALYGFSGWHGLRVGKSSDTIAAIGLLLVVGDLDDVTTALLVDGSDTAATDVVGAVKVVVVTVVVVVDTRMTVVATIGISTTVLVVASLLSEVAARTVDVVAATTLVAVNGTTSASDVVLNLDGLVVETPSSSEMTTVSWKSNSISGKAGVAVAGAVDV